MSGILLHGGTVIDGTGKAEFSADVLIEDDKIIDVQPFITPPKGTHIIDATGKTITPGFIHMHSHADCSVAMCPDMESSLGQGITTEFAGHCGLGVAPVEKLWLYMFPEKKAFNRVTPDPIGGINPYNIRYVPTDALRQPFFEEYGERLDWSSYSEYISHLKRTGIGANMALVVGHGQLRLQAMGTNFRRSATKQEQEYMRQALTTAIDAGAMGLSFGLDYQPGLFADHEELLYLMKLVAGKNGIVTSHIRSLPNSYYDKEANVYSGLNEFLELGKQSGARIHVSHIQNVFTDLPENEKTINSGVHRTLKLLDKAVKDGVRVSWDIIPKHAFGPFHYPMAASLFQPYVEQCGGCTAFSEKLSIGSYRDEIMSEINSGNHVSRGIFTRINPKTNPQWDTQQRFTRCKNISIVGKTIHEAANSTDSLAFLLDVLAHDPFASVISLMRRPDNTPDRDAFVNRPEATIALDTWSLNYNTVLNSDSMPLECGSPSTYSGMGVFLETQIKRESKESVIKKLTGNAAKILGLTDRGIIQKGSKADLLLIDFNHFSSAENLADPRQGVNGLELVLINGKIAVESGTHTHVRNGKVLSNPK